jgi:integrase
LATNAPCHRFPISFPKSTSCKSSHINPPICPAGASLQSAFYGTHSMRRTKAAQIYRKTGNLRAVQILLGHTKLESTVRYLGIEVDDALNMAEQIEL